MLEAILLDRDGVINRERKDYVKCWEEMEILPGVLTALRRLAELPIPICVVTNQSVIGRQIVSADVVDDLHTRLATLVAAHGGRIDAFFICPHRPDEHCSCRKPEPGLLLQASQQFKLDLTRCIFFGDSVTDYMAAVTVGCQSMLVQTKFEGTAQSALPTELVGATIVTDLTAAAEAILHRYVYRYQTR